MERQQSNTMSTYNTSRKVAAKLLKVSIRTVDRYIANNKLSSRVVNGRVLLDKNEILAIKKGRHIDDMVDIDVSIDNIQDKQPENDIDMSTVRRKTVSTPTWQDASAMFEIYKRLYEEAYDDLKSKQIKLEAANYHIGQLEAQIHYSIPLLEHQRETARLLGTEESLKSEMEQVELEARKLAKDLSTEKLSKKIYVVILFILLLLQPLWLFFIRFA